MKATVHLVRLGDPDDLPSTQDIEAKYPGFGATAKRGDIIENVDESGYRSYGVYMYDGQEIIKLGYDWDDYGHPSEEFKLITEFPPGYWDNGDHFEPRKLPTHAWDDPNDKSEFYWHSSEFIPCAIDVVKLNLRSMVESGKKLLKKSGDWFLTKVYKGKTYQIQIGNDEQLERFKSDIKKNDIICVYDCEGRIKYNVY